MFDKFQQLKQAKELQKQLQGEREETEKNGVKVVINGKMQIEEVTLNPELEKEDQEKLVKEAFNESMKKLQSSIAQKMNQT